MKAIGLSPAWKSRLRTLRGNLSLWLLGLSILIFKAWQWYFGYPGDSEIAILGGILRLKVGYLASLITFVFGWLVGIYSLKNLQKAMVHFFRPLGLVNDPETQEFFTAPATTIFSLALLLFVFDAVTANTALKITSRYEVFLNLPKGNSTFLMLSDGKTGERTSLKPGQTIRIALRGRDDSQLLLVRDQYNLITLDALHFAHSSFGISIGSRALAAVNPGVTQKPIRGLRETGLFEIELTGPLRYSQKKVDVTITPLGKEIKRGGWVQPGTGSECPERSGPVYARKFFQSLCDNRNLFSVWETIPVYHEKLNGIDSTLVYHSIGQYDIVVTFENISIKTPEDSFATREAKEIIATEKEVK